MPELPEVETVRRGLNDVTLAQTIQGGDVLLDRTIAHPFSVPDFLTALKGTAIVQWHRRGKYLLAELEPSLEQSVVSRQPSTVSRSEISALPYRPIAASPSATYSAVSHSPLPTPHSPSFTPHLSWLGVHLRMTGQLLWVDQTEPLEKHTRVRLFFGGGKELRFVDQRTFGQMWWVPPENEPEQIITGLQQLGPEPFSEEFSVPYFTQKLQRRRPIKNALLDQSIVAGIGNIYADEALFLSGVHPQTLCIDLQPSQIERLRSHIIQVLEASIEAKGTTFRTFRSVAGVNGNYGGSAWVYGRDGDVCRNCTTEIERLRMAGRSAHFCPTCQSLKKG
ncbi:DNA-formamidopyrimidine glycosylase [Leptolyngbya sp. FACHB-321]|uniref:DNA-formamidopyrimidine glycosylase n=1 Tax=Leptolyngbya sp. FACHB-321 TaxID=2692807 RepID=UPI0016855DA4|nr:DNA-formamidopyrimidine glycosylase [Leptolyngbya sp. FACHB-321]